jgi:predicted GNAT family acetyltransferase
MMLDRGMDFCFLFTDLSNPISNSIYAQIGYVPVTDCIMYDLER